ncbi:MAG: LacI family DNA-binding transcriptional regulator [Gemmatimonadota bacterium]
MSRERITLKDIAKRVGVSVPTVSRALADHPDIHEETKARVRDVAQELHYIPNYRARYLRAKYSRLLALVVPEMNTFFVPSLVTGINGVAQRNDYSLIVFQSEDAIVQERRLLEDCVRLSVDGVLLALSSETSDLAHLRTLGDAGIPVVLLDKTIRTDEHSAVTIDDERVGAEAAEYLLRNGHRRAIGLFADDRQRISKLRRRGFQRAFASAGAPLEEDLLLRVSLLDELPGQLGSALDAHPDVTAVFAMSDELLVRAHHLLMRRGARVPQDVALLAISDGQAPYFLFPSVTHIRHSGAVVGERAAHTLIGLIDHSADSTMEVKVATRLVELGSVGARE